MVVVDVVVEDVVSVAYVGVVVVVDIVVKGVIALSSSA